MDTGPVDAVDEVLAVEGRFSWFFWVFWFLDFRSWVGLKGGKRQVQKCACSLETG